MNGCNVGMAEARLELDFTQESLALFRSTGCLTGENLQSFHPLGDQMFDLDAIFHDVAKRLYIMAGMAGFLAMVPLAITSTAAMVRRMGAKNWQRLHRLTYFATLAGVIHYYWLVKSDIREPAMYGSILLIEMLYRLRMWTAKKPQPVPVTSARA